MTPKALARLEAKAAQLAQFPAYADANRDGWFATMPPDVAESAAEEAADLRALLADRDAAVAALREIEKGLDAHRIVSGSLGPLYTVGWNQAVLWFADFARTYLTRLEPEKTNDD